MFLQRFLSFVRRDLNRRDKALTYVILGCIVAMPISLVLFMLDAGAVSLVVVESVAECAGLILLLLHGTIMQTAYWKYIVGSIVAITVAVLLITLQVQGGLVLLFIGILVLEVVYTIRFVNQRYTNTAGWITYGWICSRCVTAFGVIINRLPYWSLSLPCILFWLALVFFFSTEMRLAKYKIGTEA
jgi:hypothetical protein